MEKPILVNGSPRSGTTYLYRYLRWKFGKALYEPLVVLRLLRNVTSDVMELMELVKLNPLVTINPQFGSWWFHDVEALKRYLMALKGYAIKEVTLHLYLAEDFIKDNWDVYHIIRHPADNYLSYLYWRGKRVRYSVKVVNFLARLGFDSLFSKFSPVWEAGRRLALIFTKNPREPIDYDDAFISLWTITNYYVLKALGRDKIIVYNKREDFSKLPDFDVYEEKVERLRIKEYPEREKVMERFVKKVEKLGISDMFEELMLLFE